MLRTKGFFLTILFALLCNMLNNYYGTYSRSLVETKNKEIISLHNNNVNPLISNKKAKNHQESDNLLFQTENLNSISEDNTLANPFIELKDTYSNSISFFNENELKNKIGFKINFFYSISNISLYFVNNNTNIPLPNSDFLSYIVNTDSIILFRQILI